MNNYKYINVRDYGARGDGQTDDTAAIDKAFVVAKAESDAGRSATVFIPPGEYMVGTAATGRALEFNASGCKLTGGGTLKYRPNCSNNMMLRVTGDRNVIEWIRIDANYSVGVVAATDGYHVSGDFNRSRNVYVFGCAQGPENTDPKGDSLQHFGKAGTMHRCTSVGGYTSLRDGGNPGFNIMRYCLGLEYGRKGYNNSEKLTVWTTVVGVHTESTYVSTTGAAGYQIDPEALSATFDRAILRDCTGRPETEPGSTSNGAKFAVVKDVYLDGCQFIHEETECTTLRFAERIDRVRVKDTFLSRDVFIEPSWPNPPEEMRFERTIVGDGAQHPASNMTRMRCKLLRLSDVALIGATQAAIRWEYPESSYQLIAAINCDFIGYSAGVVADVRPATGDGGELTSSRRALWLGNRRTNSGGGSSVFIVDVAPTTVGRGILATTRDASMRTLEWSSVPSTTTVNWFVGDTVAKSSPGSGNFYGWVCTSSGPPSVWKEFSVIA